jgi:hypothetical protein
LILQTTNGGANWTQRTGGVTGWLRGVAHPGVNVVVIVGDSGTILRSTDAGVSWKRQVSGTSRTLRGVFFPDPDHGTAVGDSGTILRTSNGGATWVWETGDRMPASYGLDQNYPNPFNGASEIGFVIPDLVRVKLAVYDMLGREIATLVDETKVPGRYRFTIDAGRMSSGTYLYRLTAGSFVQTRAMVLIR